MFYIYHLIDSETNIPFYVGKGKGQRYQDHMYDARKSRNKQENPLKCNKIQSLLERGVDIVIRKIAHFDDEQSALNFEQQEILKYGKIIDNTGCLTNIQDGGTQPPQRPRKIVYAFTNTGELAHTFQSTFDAACYFGVNVSVVQNCCAGRCKTCKRHALFYTISPSQNDILNRFTNGNIKIDTIFQLNESHQVINTYASLTEAAKIHTTTSRQLSSAISHQYRHKGWYWSR